MPHDAEPSPRVFFSYSHDSAEHRDRVRALAERLRADGIDCRLDLWAEAPPQGWPAWMEHELEAADFVLVVSTSGYRAKARVVPPGEGGGHGVRFESVLVTQDLYDAGMWNERFIPILLADARPEDIARPLRPYPYYRADTESGYESLYRRLTLQPEYVAPELGARRNLPPRERAGSAAGGSQEASAVSHATIAAGEDRWQDVTPGRKSAGAAEAAGAEDERDRRSSVRTRLEIAGLAVALVVGALTIPAADRRARQLDALVGAVFELPKKWRDFWSGGGPPVERPVADGEFEEAPRASFELRLVDARDGSPLASVEVAIPELGLAAASDEHGVARLHDLPVAPETMVRVRASSPGYEPREQEVTVGLGVMDHWRLEPASP